MNLTFVDNSDGSRTWRDLDNRGAGALRTSSDQETVERYFKRFENQSRRDVPLTPLAGIRQRA